MSCQTYFIKLTSFLLCSLDTGKPVISFNEKGQPEISYSPRLVTLMREVRQLRVFGYVIPNKILNLEEKAKKFYSQAKVLQQVRFFMHSSIISSRIYQAQLNEFNKFIFLPCFC